MSWSNRYRDNYIKLNSNVTILQNHQEIIIKNLSGKHKVKGNFAYSLLNIIKRCSCTRENLTKYLANNIFRNQNVIQLVDMLINYGYAKLIRLPTAEELALLNRYSAISHFLEEHSDNAVNALRQLATLKCNLYYSDKFTFSILQNTLMQFAIETVEEKKVAFNYHKISISSASKEIMTAYIKYDFNKLFVLLCPSNIYEIAKFLGDISPMCYRPAPAASAAAGNFIGFAILCYITNLKIKFNDMKVSFDQDSLQVKNLSNIQSVFSL